MQQIAPGSTPGDKATNSTSKVSHMFLNHVAQAYTLMPVQYRKEYNGYVTAIALMQAYQEGMRFSGANTPAAAHPPEATPSDAQLLHGAWRRGSRSVPPLLLGPAPRPGPLPSQQSVLPSEYTPVLPPACICRVVVRTYHSRVQGLHLGTNHPHGNNT